MHRLRRMKSIKWNRDLVWEESPQAVCDSFDPATAQVPGSIESTAGGQFLEKLNLFSSQADVTFANVPELWKVAEAKFAAGASGRVTLCVANARPNSMFKLVSLPAFQRNPNVTLKFV